jgi:mannonate dehydratase
MNRRNILHAFGGAGTGLLAAQGPLAQAQETARRGLPPVKITDIKTILTQPGGDHLVIVKVLTSEPGLYGIGCATHRERPLAVASYVDNYLKPFLIGRNCDEIEDIWQSTYVQSYFRSGVTGNNALSGVDGALWDILGKRCGVPVYKLFGGKVRAAVPLYTHASAREFSELEDQIQKFRAEGYRYIRVQLAVPGYSGYGVSAETSDEIRRARPEGVPSSPVFEPTPYINNTIKMFEQLRTRFGFDLEFLHDVHERVPPNQAIQRCKAVEPYRPFFMEDPSPPKTWVGFEPCDSKQYAQSPWASCSSIAMSGCFSWPSA